MNWERALLERSLWQGAVINVLRVRLLMLRLSERGLYLVPGALEAA